MSRDVRIFVNDVDIYVCTICRDVMKDPTSCKEGHSFCNSCVLEWLAHNSTCPSCRCTLNADGLFKQRIVEEAIQREKICCPTKLGIDVKKIPLSPINTAPTRKRKRAESAERAASRAQPGRESKRRRKQANEPQGASSQIYEEQDSVESALHEPAQVCDWSGRLSELEAHRNECDYVVRKCRYHINGCLENDAGKRIKLHESECDYAPAVCDACGKKYTKRSLETHKKTKCPKFVIECPNACTDAQSGEKTRLARQELCQHERVCPFAIIPCPFSKFGCEYMCTRTELEDHEKEFAEKHLSLSREYTESQRVFFSFCMKNWIRIKDIRRIQEFRLYDKTWKITFHTYRDNKVEFSISINRKKNETPSGMSYPVKLFALDEIELCLWNHPDTLEYGEKRVVLEIRNTERYPVFCLNVRTPIQITAN